MKTIVIFTFLFFLILLIDNTESQGSGGIANIGAYITLYKERKQRREEAQRKQQERNFQQNKGRNYYSDDEYYVDKRYDCLFRPFTQVLKNKSDIILNSLSKSSNISEIKMNKIVIFAFILFAILLIDYYDDIGNGNQEQSVIANIGAYLTKYKELKKKEQQNIPNN
ncbi:hypothetical protein PVAND_012311 [Polypedilum vanderplanki]|uniref:Selenoprotein n=1 Tax=Polypedilum vanderplanki TaxID=319348 RepID=A0A9J6CMC0_POLVA|nr:hypothetical protein PVAND_012311 [Polypedilum vanderplanki]